jgi:TRAP-type C4-dicarboxylate transport system permease small subunit
MSRIKNETALKIIYILKRVLIIGLWLLLIKEAVPVIQRNYLFETSSVILRIPMWPLYTIVTVVMASVVLINLEKILVQLLPPKDHAGNISV